MKIQNLIYAGFISLLLINLSGCAELQQDWINDNCNASAAYANGMNDGKDGQDMQANYAGGCPANISELNQAYQKGFKYGLAHALTPAPVPAQVNIYNGTNAAN
jgi:hypothetical protein